jgi:DNA-binding XRE family transcriptional regulator
MRWGERRARKAALALADGWASTIVQRLAAANLSEARERAGLTQGQLAERSGLHRTEISLIEHQGDRPLSDLWRVPPIS